MKSPNAIRRARIFVGDFLLALTVFFVILAVACLDSRAAKSAAITASSAGPALSQGLAPGADPKTVTIGSLLLSQRGGSAEEVSPAPLLSTDINITVSGSIARTQVTQTFRNPGMHAFDATYAFPLPETARVDAMSVQMDDNVLTGKVIPRMSLPDVAAGNEGLRQTERPGNAGTLFQRNITNISPGAEIKVTLEYQQLLRWDGAGYSLRFPLMAAPRSVLDRRVHNAGYVERSGAAGISAHSPGGRETARNRVSLKLRMDAGFAIGEIASPSHEIALRTAGDSNAIISLNSANVPVDRDFILRWSPTDSAIPRFTGFFNEQDGHGYLTATLAAPHHEALPGRVSRDVLFALDTSGSMEGDRLELAKQSLLLALTRLRPGDRFNIYRFDRSVESLFPSPVPVSGENHSKVSGYLANLDTRGGTRILPLLFSALDKRTQADKDRLRQVVVMSDGAFTEDQQLLTELATRRGKLRFHVIGLGKVQNEALLKRAAEIGRGSYFGITDRSQIIPATGRLVERLEMPVITELKLVWPNGVRAEVHPDPLPDLHAGAPITLSARVSSLKGDIRLQGKLAGKLWETKLVLKPAIDGTAVSKAWAREKIASLEARVYSGQSRADVGAAILDTALEHEITSSMTRLAALDNREDSSSGSLGGDSAFEVTTPARASQLPPFSGTEITGSIAGAKRAPSMSKQEKLVVAGLKQNFISGDADTDSRTWLLVVMAAIFSLMTAMTLGLWRHMKRSALPTGRTRKVRSHKTYR